MREIHIYDMDGVLVDSMHRFRTLENGRIDLQYWLDNEHKALNDSLLPLSVQYKAQLADKHIYTVIATARVLNDPDKQFIAETLGKPDHIISRNGRGDIRRGAELKTNGLKKLLNLKQFRGVVRHFWEDNLDYLYPVCDAIGAIPHYIESKQGC